MVRWITVSAEVVVAEAKVLTPRREPGMTVKPLMNGQQASEVKSKGRKHLFAMLTACPAKEGKGMEMSKCRVLKERGDLVGRSMQENVRRRDERIMRS